MYAYYVLQTTLYQYFLGVGDGSKVDRNGCQSGRPQGFPEMTPLPSGWLSCGSLCERMSIPLSLFLSLSLSLALCRCLLSSVS